jgi:hypothetical protein
MDKGNISTILQPTHLLISDKKKSVVKEKVVAIKTFSISMMVVCRSSPV